jgi:hypothetical protein
MHTVVPASRYLESLGYAILMILTILTNSTIRIEIEVRMVRIMCKVSGTVLAMEGSLDECGALTHFSPPC